MKSKVSDLLIHLRARKLTSPIVEYRFHDTRKWRFDLAWPEIKLAVEVHGGAFTQGRHNRGLGFTADREKMNEALLLGWQVIEVTSEQVKSGQAIDWIERFFKLRGQDNDKTRSTKSSNEAVSEIKGSD